MTLMYIKGGHRGCIRSFAWVDNTDRVGGDKMLVTGEEDARLCKWEMLLGEIQHTYRVKAQWEVLEAHASPRMRLAILAAAVGRRRRRRNSVPLTNNCKSHSFINMLYIN